MLSAALNGDAPGTQAFIRALVERATLPLVVDADGLNAFKGHSDELRGREGRPIIVTPHPGEMARLTETFPLPPMPLERVSRMVEGPAAVAGLNIDRGLAERQIDVFRLSRTIADAANHFRAKDPARVEGIWQHIRGYRAMLAVPLTFADEVIGALVVRSREPGEFTRQAIQLMQTFAAQSVLALITLPTVIRSLQRPHQARHSEPATP